MVIEPLHSCEDLINLLQVWFGLFRYFTHLLSKVQCGLLQVIPGLFNIGHSLNTVFRDLLYSLPTIIEMINFTFCMSARALAALSRCSFLVSHSAKKSLHPLRRDCASSKFCGLVSGFLQ